MIYAYQMNSTVSSRVEKEKDLGVSVNKNLSWNDHICAITAKGNKMLGLLKRTCPLLTNTTVRRTLYLTLVRSEISYVSELWSPHTNKLTSKLESVQRRATAWILKSKRGEYTYKQRLTTLNLLLLCYEREITDLLFFLKALYGKIDLDVCFLVSFVDNGRTRLSQNPVPTIKTPYSRSTTFQASYFNRIVKLYYTCKIHPSTSFASLSSFKRNIKNMYKHCLEAKFDIDMPCMWTLVPVCPCHKL